MDDNYEFLEWFFTNADFGPAHGDVILGMFDQYVLDTGKEVPEVFTEGY
jgi:hypothetical protein